MVAVEVTAIVVLLVVYSSVGGGCFFVAACVVALPDVASTATYAGTAANSLPSPF